MEILKNEFATLTYERDLKLLILTWSDQKPSFEDYQKPFLAILEFMVKNPVYSYISDIRNQAIIPPDYRKWLQEHVMPEGVKTGLKRVVGVANVNIFKQYYINNVFQSAKKFGLPFKMFNTIDEAKEWLGKFD